jgi:hypothetical protein
VFGTFVIYLVVCHHSLWLKALPGSWLDIASFANFFYFLDDF